MYIIAFLVLSLISSLMVLTSCILSSRISKKESANDLDIFGPPTLSPNNEGETYEYSRSQTNLQGTLT